MPSFENVASSMQIMQIVIPVVSGIIFIAVLAIILSPRVRAKFMGKQVKATKYMMDENEEYLRNISNRAADISAPGVEKTARAVKRGFEDERKYCKYCGEAIDGDAVFCSKCGRRQ